MASNNPKPLPTFSAEDIKRFWSKIDVRGPEECWPWMANKNAKGYGNFRAANRQLRANRVALYLSTGVDPFPLEACHSCDFPPCSNGRHLSPGTTQANIAERDIKGRTARGDRSGPRLHPDRMLRGDQHPNRIRPERMARGERQHLAKLSAAQVVEIRLLNHDGVSSRALGIKFGVDKSTIKRIVRRKTWAHVP